MSSLPERLRARIAREGSISFRDFMAAALYDPEDGYYSRGARIGERGDFVTSPLVSPAFAETIARRFREDAARLTGPLQFLELGAGDGQFLQDFATSLARPDPGLAARVQLVAVEPSRVGREALARRGIPGPPAVLESAEAIAEASVSGWVFSNELFDALPVVLVEGGGATVLERRVVADENGFSFTMAPAPPGLREHLAAFGVELAPGQSGEVAPDAAPLYARLARALLRGRIVTFDYGHRARVLYHEAARRSGTLAVHSGGRRRGNPLVRPGEVDLTAHVNWDALIRAGEAEGLSTDGLFRQGRFLIESGIFDFTPAAAERWRAYRLVDPEGMGEELSVLVQSRGMSDRTPPVPSN